MSFANDHALAGTIAAAAGRALMALRDSGLIEGPALGDAGDRLANILILDALAFNRPDDAVLSEESADDKSRCARDRVWIVDPLDGTREYSDGRDDWTVHVALAIGGVPAVGAVALPARDMLFVTGGTIDPSPARPARRRMLVSRTRPAPEALAVAKAIGAELVPMGSAGAKAMAVVRGEADIYLHSGGQYEWDSCAPVAVAAAAGLHVSRIDGSPLIYNRADVSLPDLLICERDEAPAILAAIRALDAEANIISKA